jgi:hypothetical protein
MHLLYGSIVARSLQKLSLHSMVWPEEFVASEGRSVISAVGLDQKQQPDWRATLI